MEDLRMVLPFRAKEIEGHQKNWRCPSQDRGTAVETLRGMHSRPRRGTPSI